MVAPLSAARMPLEGLTVLEVGSLIAGPFAGKILAEFGAEVIKIEPPGKGDPLRVWRHVHDGTSLWFRIQGRNKKSITLDLRRLEGQELVRQLVADADILIENFRPGTLERWNLGWPELQAVNPRLVFVRVSGFGQDGPYRDRAGFGSVGESMGGMRYVTGYPDRPPVRVGISIGDALAAMYGAMGALMAVYNRDVGGTGRGQMIDVALYEAVFAMMEGLVPEFDVFGAIRERTGSSLPGIAPSNTYRTADGRYIVIGGNADGVFKRLMAAIGRSDVGEDPRFAGDQGRAEAAEFLDSVIEEWTQTKTLDEAMEIMVEAGVPAGPIYTAREMISDPQFLARGMIQEIDLPGYGPVKFPGIVPKLTETPGRIKWLGPELGQHNDEIYLERLGLSPDAYQRLRDQGVV